MSVTTFELFTLANVCCGTVVYIAWWKKPFDIRTPIIVTIREPLQTDQTIKRVTFTGIVGLGPKNSDAMYTLAFGLFGALHIIGWDFHFSSDVEKWLWRASSITCTVIFAIWWGLDMLTANDNFLYLQTGLYFIARLYMFVEMFVGLRSVPKDVFQTVQWSQYFPALG